MPTRLALLVALALTALQFGCAGAPATSDQDLRVLDFDQLVAMRGDDGPGLVLVDVRSPRQYAAGHIPGAINIPLPELRRDLPQLTGAGAIAVYADDWTDNLSAAAAKRLVALGYENVYDFREGLTLWQSRGGRIE